MVRLKRSASLFKETDQYLNRPIHLLVFLWFSLEIYGMDTLMHILQETSYMLGKDLKRFGKIEHSKSSQHIHSTKSSILAGKTTYTTYTLLAKLLKKWRCEEWIYLPGVKHYAQDIVEFLLPLWHAVQNLLLIPELNSYLLSLWISFHFFYENDAQWTRSVQQPCKV